MLGKMGVIFHGRGGLGPLTQSAATAPALPIDVEGLSCFMLVDVSSSSSSPVPKSGALELARMSGVVERDCSESVSSWYSLYPGGLLLVIL